MAPHRPTIKDVALAAGVSPTTVSRVMNRRGYLSEDTIAAVEDAMARIGYHPNTVARGLRVQRSEEVGVLMPSLADPFYAELTSEIENELALRGYRMLVGSTHKDPQREIQYVDLLHSSRVAGLLSSSHTNVLRDYAHLQLPVVTLDRLDSPSIPNVSCDNGKAARDVAQLLWDGGARKPLLLTSTADTRHPRQAQFVNWWKEHAGITVPVVPLGFGRPRPDQAREVAEVMALSRTEGIDAVFCTNDLFAGVVLEWAHRENISVPDQLQIVGFDGTELMRSLLPTLTTVVQPLAGMAKCAVDVLLDMTSAETEHPNQYYIDATIHYGQTTVITPTA